MSKKDFHGWNSVQLYPILADFHVFSFKVLFKTSLKKKKNPRMNLTERLTDIEKEWCLLGEGVGQGEGWARSLGSADTIYAI